MTLQRCLPPAELNGGPRGYVLGKVSFPLLLPRVVEGLPGCWGGGSIHASSPGWTQPPVVPLSPAERAAPPLTCCSTWDGTWGGLGDHPAEMSPCSSLGLGLGDSHHHQAPCPAGLLSAPSPGPPQGATAPIHPLPAPGRDVHCPLYLTVWEFLLRLCLPFAVLICTSLGSFIPLHRLLSSLVHLLPSTSSS